MVSLFDSCNEIVTTELDGVNVSLNHLTYSRLVSII